MPKLHGDTALVPSTARLELFSDGVFAILITLLAIDIHVPFLADESTATVLTGIMRTMPHIWSFGFSFFALAVFWVNHHHFFHTIDKTDWVLLWHNMHLLFWLALIPFTTAFLGEYPTAPVIAAIYALNLALAAAAFSFMTQHAYFHGCFTTADVPEKERRDFVRRGRMGAFAYAFAALMAFGSVWVTWALILAIPLYYVVPRLLKR